MAVRSFSNASIRTGVVRSKFWDQNTVILNPAFESIASVSPTSGTSVTFSSIPADYQHLQLRWNLDNGGNTQLLLRMNSDTGSNYSFHLLYGTGSSAAATGGSSATSINYGGFAGTSSGLAVGIIDIVDYASTTKYKTTKTFSGRDTNGTGWIQLSSGLWQSTSAITSITLIDPNYTFSNGTIALYGIKAAA